MSKQILNDGEFALKCRPTNDPLITDNLVVTFKPTADKKHIAMTLTCTFDPEQWAKGAAIPITVGDCGVFDTYKDPPNQTLHGGFAFNVDYDSTIQQITLTPQASPVILTEGVKGERGTTLESGSAKKEEKSLME